MAGFALVTFYNPADEASDQAPQWLDAHLVVLRNMAGFRRLLHSRLADIQIMPDCPQPYRALLVHEFDSGPDDDQLAALAHALAQLPERASHVFEWIGDWRRDLAHADPETRFTHLTVVMANIAAGQEADYHAWYEGCHMAETLAVPGPVAIRRGQLSSRQLSPDNAHPAGFLVLCAGQTDDAAVMVAELMARSMGTSASGIRFTQRPTTLSSERTIHFMNIDAQRR